MTAETSQGQAPVAPNPLHEAIAENVRANSRSKQQPTKLELVGEDEQPRDTESTLAVLAEMAAPFDDETLERWIGEVKPMVEAA